jgi:ParB family chromosome partitioning protein
MANRERVIVRWKLSCLKPHPLQAALFGDISEAELAALAADMEKRGQRQSVEVLPDGTVIAGHQRLRAAKLLGWKEVEVKVRHDLADAGDNASEAELIRDNLYRRHLNPLARARSIARLMEIETDSRGRSQSFSKEEVLAAVAAQLGLSVRSVRRYLLVLEAPVGVQWAFERGEVDLKKAGNIAMLPKWDKEKIGQRLEAGEAAALVVKEILQKQESPNQTANLAFGRLVRMLSRETPTLRGLADEISVERLKRCLPDLKQAIKLLRTWLRLAESSDR